MIGEFSALIGASLKAIQQAPKPAASEAALPKLPLPAPAPKSLKNIVIGFNELKAKLTKAGVDFAAFCEILELSEIEVRKKSSDPDNLSFHDDAQAAIDLLKTNDGKKQ